MQENFTQEVKLLSRDLDRLGRIRTISLARFMEDTAIQAAAAGGFDEAWYRAHMAGWFMRTFALQRLGSGERADSLTVSTWVSSVGRVRLETEYEVHRPDGTPVAVGRAERIYMDLARLRPQNLDPSMTAIWTAQPASDLWRDFEGLVLPLGQPVVTREQRAYRYDTDYLGHVNNAIYLNWLEESAGEALGEGLPQDVAAPACQVDLKRIVISYLIPTQPGETVSITTIPVNGTADGRLVQLNHELVGPDGAVRVRAEAIYKRTKCES